MKTLRPRLVALLCASLLGTACADGSGSVEPEPAAEPEPEPTAEPEPEAEPRTCGVTVPGAVSVQQAALLEFDVGLDLGGGVTAEEVSLALTAPEGWRLEVTEDKVTGRVGDQTGTVTVTSTCSDGEGASASVDVTVEPMTTQALASWTPGDDGPLGREYFNMWVDPTDADTMWLFGGFHYVPQQFTVAWDMWRYDLVEQTWSEVPALSEPPHLAGGGMAVFPDGHPRAGEALHHGGLSSDFGTPFSLTAVDPDAAGAMWTEAAVTGAPGTGSYQPAVFYDAARDGVWVIGGQDGGGPHLDVSFYDEQSTAWSSVQLAFGALPEGRTGFFWTFDAAADRFIVAFGEKGGAQAGCNCAQDTWLLDLSPELPKWRRISTGDSQMIGRRNGAFVLDAERQRMFVFGGTNDGASTFPGLWMLDLAAVDGIDWDNPTEVDWVEVDIGNEIPVRSSGAMVYDGARDRLVLGFGNGAAIYRDLWTIEF